MISSSKIITDTLSRSQTRASPDDLPFESSSFDAIFRTTHPEKAKLGPSGKRKTSGRVMYECLHCPPDSPWSNGKRGNAIYHAKRKHASILQTEASTVDEHDSDIITRPSKQPRMDSFFPSRPSDTTLRRVFNRQQYIESIVGLLTRRRLPFSAVKWDEMQDIILACNPAIEDLLLTSRDAAMRHITTTFDLYRSQLKAKLQASVSKIHLSTDLWTSPHRHGILAVCVRWVDNGYRLQKALLAMPECRYSHSGERQATLMAEAIEEYGIAKQIGYHTGDNATSNDTCLKHLSQMLQDKYGISFHPNQRRIRCIAHIINLSLQAFLLASSKEALRAALAAASDVTGAEMYEQFYFTLYDVSANEPTSRSEASEQQEQSFSKVWKGKAKRAARKPPDFRDDKFRGWQTIPAMRKLHNIAVWLRNSSIHSDLWEDRVSLRLGIDNDTRWNSWYKLIDNLIRRQSQIKQFLLDYDKEINDNILNSSDWDYLERTYRFLHPFASATLWAEGKNSTLSQILTIMDGLLRHYEKNKEHYSKPETFDRRILHSIEMGWFILDKYYTMTEDAPVYAAALLLDPSKRIRYIERHWPESWHENAIAGVRTIWEEYKTQPETGPAESVDEVSASQKRQPNEWDALLEELEVTEDLGDSMDDLEDFIKATPIKISGSPLQWWCHKDQRKTYPQLSRMAIDILSIAPESADPESAFSGGRRTLSWDRERMTCENLEKVECIGNWLREGHIQKTVHGGAYIFEFEENHDTAKFYRTADDKYTTRVKFDYDLFKGVSIQFDDVSTAEDMAAKMAALPAVKNMWPVKVYSIPKPRIEWTATPGMKAPLKKRDLNDTADTFSPHVQVQVDKLREKGITGHGIKVAVVDTGIDYKHPALGGCFGPNCLVSFGTDLVGDKYDGFNAVYPDDDPMDCQGHGSHVAGIVAAQENEYGFTGAAPGVTLGAYRVFGCSGEAGNDVLIAAFNQAYQDGADIITASIGGPSGWSEEPWAVAVSRIVEKGVPCTVSAGNSGDVGMFYASTAANGNKVMAIASYDNSDYVSLLNISHYTVDNSSKKIDFGSTAGSPAAWGNVTLPLWAPNLDPATPNGGCDAYPADTPDLSKYIVLVRRGSCTFVQKAQNAAKHGAKYFLVYNNAASGASAIDVSTVEGIVAAGMVPAKTGTKWVELLKAGSTVTLEMSDGSDGKVILEESKNNVTGGAVSTYSSWGPTWELDVKPQFGSPGGNILSTYPLKKGGYAVLSGTSMACPLVAGVIALIAEVRGTLDPEVLENLLSSTSNPTLFNDGAMFYDYLAPVPQQGGGLIQAYDAAYSTLLLSRSSLAFNDTDHFTEVLNFTLHNTGKTDLDLSISHIPTKSVYTLAKDSIYASEFPNDVADGHASLKFSESKVSVGAGDSVTIEVMPTPPEGLDAKRLALWSGYIAVNGTGVSLSLPYQGLTGSLHDSKVLASDDTWISKSNDKDELNPVPANTTFVLPVKGQNATDEKPAPALAWKLALGSAKLEAELIPVSGNSTAKSLGAPAGFPTLWNPMGKGSVVWNGKLADGGYAPAGKYKVAYRALRIFGDEKKESDWDKSESPVFGVRYP
ncbi:hypothetical protein HZS61_004731 [Fusarium oxysporum f. sp. conglutinans]|uniref:Peptidase S8/S53 domain-containing protein n=4 Tax=Fusarium oxysporum TaxID=5507 RepID=A0A8H6LEF9_FUSOX|nr:hypothetical protein HZS61_004731 [Fusarium oxysporum f. sp. conglutinans]KAG6979949.1 Minor extracellular protease vpr [Fusarium oxysporum f. sp. conglutinans]